MSKISQLISCIFLMILSSQSWSVVTTQIDSYQYGANVDVFVEYVELTQKNHVYDGTQNLLYCCYKQLVNAQDLKIRDGSFFASSDGFFATKNTPKLLASPRKHLLDSVTDQRLRNRIDALYRPNAKVGSGSTADAIRHELRTGELLSPKGHFQKGIEMRNGLMKDLKSGRLNDADSAIARRALKDLQNALSGQ